MTRFNRRTLVTHLALIAVATAVAEGPAGAQQGDQAPGEIPYYWETRPATSAAVVGGLQRPELLCGVQHEALAGSAIMCALTGTESEDESDDPNGEQVAEPIAPQRVPTFAETVESILTGPR